MGTPLLLSTACQGSGGLGLGGGEEPPKRPARLMIAPADHADKVAPDRPVRVEVQHGTIRQVVLRATKIGEKGEEGSEHKAEEGESVVRGALNAERTAWRSAGRLRPDTTYAVTAKAVGEDGKTASAASSFTTLEPDRLLHTRVAPLDGEEVGVGMPIIVYFTHEVADDKRADVERRLQVKMSEPVEGAWHWMDGGEVHFRPRHYWPEGEQVTFTADLVGVHGGSGLWGNTNRTVSFHVGSRHISVVDAEKHMMTVSSDGDVVKHIPVSTGRPGDDTSHGVHVAQEKAQTTIMDSATTGCPPGCPGYYRITTHWNVRITNSGEFVHSAPWSVGAQGNTNVSHGCVNASPSDAEWFYHFTRRGDIIKVVNTPKELRWRNGFTDWTMSWSKWKAGSALDRSINSSAPASPAPAASTPSSTPAAS